MQSIFLTLIRRPAHGAGDSLRPPMVVFMGPDPTRSDARKVFQNHDGGITPTALPAALSARQARRRGHRSRLRYNSAANLVISSSTILLIYGAFGFPELGV
jgi:hypothetical protein